MRWTITLAASQNDVERLVAESLPDVSASPTDPKQLLFELRDPEGNTTGKEATRAVKAAIDAFVRRINGVGKLRWGRTFEGVAAAAVETFDGDGPSTQHVFLEPAFDHMLPEDFADMVVRLGRPRPPLPIGIDVINALECASVADLAEASPEVGRVLHLVELMLEGDREIDWVAAYSAVEVIEHDLASRGLDGQTLGWWRRAELRNFKATANSPEAVGFRARHGRPSGLAEARMTSKDASWFVRRVAAQWVTDLLGPPGARRTP